MRDSNKNMQPRLITLDDGTCTWVLCEVCPPSGRRFRTFKQKATQSNMTWTRYTARINRQEAKEE